MYVPELVYVHQVFVEACKVDRRESGPLKGSIDISELTHSDSNLGPLQQQ